MYNFSARFFVSFSTDILFVYNIYIKLNISNPPLDIKEENHRLSFSVYYTRRVYGLSTVLYCETEMEKNSVITAVVREPKDNNYPITSFHDLKGKTACFSEYGGIGWLSFINTVRTNGVISSRSCAYPLLVSKLLSGACTPGIKDADHLHTAASEEVSSKLCSACMHGNNTSCAVNETNFYYGDKGALRCLADGAGDIAIVEAGNILGKAIIYYTIPCVISRL